MISGPPGPPGKRPRSAGAAGLGAAGEEAALRRGPRRPPRRALPVYDKTQRPCSKTSASFRPAKFSYMLQAARRERKALAATCKKFFLEFLDPCLERMRPAPPSDGAAVGRRRPLLNVKPSPRSSKPRASRVVSSGSLVQTKRSRASRQRRTGRDAHDPDTESRP